jgi:hypothetical protein
VIDRPIDRAAEHILVILIHPEHEAAVDHDAEAVQPIADGGVIASEVLPLVAAHEIRRREGLEADEQAAQSRGRRAFGDVAAQDRIDRRRALKEPSNAAHAIEQRRGKAGIAEQVIVEKVEMATRQALDLGEGIVDALGVEGSAAVEERVLVAEIAVLRAAARHDDRIRHEIRTATNQIATDGRKAIERAAGGGDVASQRPARAEIFEELRERLLAGAEEDRIRVRGGFIGERGHVQAAEGDEDAFRAIAIGERVGAFGVGDVDLDGDEIGSIVRVERGDVLVDDHGVIIGSQIRRERREAEGREERVFDRPPIRACRFGQSGEDELHAHYINYFAI